MGGNNSQANRFPLPDDWNVTEYICMIIPVPNDPQYIAMMRGLIDTLTWSRSFRLHPTLQAARQVADTWAAAFQSKEISFEDCDMPAFRIDPETCLLEVNCSSDPEAPNWQPVFTPAYDDSQDGEQPIPYPDPPPPGQDNRCIAAANTTEFLKQGTTQFATLLDSSGVIGVIIAALYTFLSGVITVVLINLWQIVQVNYSGFNALTILDDLAAFDWDEVDCILAARYEDNGTMTHFQWQNTLTDFQDRIPDNQIWQVLFMVFSLMGTVGAAFAASWAGITEADCDTCEWCHTFDFTTGVHGWYSVTEDLGKGSLPSATYVLGTGWTPNAANIRDRIRIAYDLPAGTVVNKVTNNFTPAMTGDARWSQLNSAGGVFTQIVPENSTPSVFTFAPVLYGNPIGVTLDDSSGDIVYAYHISSIEVCGVGIEPDWG